MKPVTAGATAGERPAEIVRILGKKVMRALAWKDCTIFTSTIRRKVGLQRSF